MPITPAMEDVFTIEPPPVRSIAGISCFRLSQTPFTFTSMMWS
jgi:hypothetical protein